MFELLLFSSTDRDGAETAELGSGGADWEDEVSPTICDDQVHSDINLMVKRVNASE